MAITYPTRSPSALMTQPMASFSNNILADVIKQPVAIGGAGAESGWFKAGLKQGVGSQIGSLIGTQLVGNPGYSGTIGGMGGGYLGAKIGAQFGSIGGPLGAAAGALIGSVLGGTVGKVFGLGKKDSGRKELHQKRIQEASKVIGTASGNVGRMAGRMSSRPLHNVAMELQGLQGQALKGNYRMAAAAARELINKVNKGEVRGVSTGGRMKLRLPEFGKAVLSNPFTDDFMSGMGSFPNVQPYTYPVGVRKTPGSVIEKLNIMN